MQFFYWLIFLMAIGIAIFAVQNSSAAPVVIKFLIWRFQTSLVYTILGSIGLGILVTLLFWIPRALRASFRSKKPNQEVPPT
jgi:putative membrane protein